MVLSISVCCFSRSKLNSLKAIHNTVEGLKPNVGAVSAGQN